jgi:hypothetical protein
MDFKKLGIKIAFFVVGFGLIGGLLYVSMIPSLNNFKEKNATQALPLMKVYYSGGKCADDTTCSKKENVYQNGKFENHADLTKEQVSTLTSLIEQSDLDAVFFSEGYDCPSTYDGQDISFAFPEKYGDTLYTICKIQNSEKYPLLVYASSLLK